MIIAKIQKSKHQYFSHTFRNSSIEHISNEEKLL